MKSTDKILKKIEQDIQKTEIYFKEEEIGLIEEVKDEVVYLSGLDHISYGELINFGKNVKGIAIELAEEGVGAIILGNYLSIKEGDQATSTGRVSSTPVGKNFISRVVDGMGNQIDGQGRIEFDKIYPLERIAPGVVYRKPVDTPLHTGIKAIDALIPIGRGQRELIIGDRSTGKSTIAVDTILSQKDEQVICIYNMIGQKKSKVAETYDLLLHNGAMDYTTIVAASSSDPVSCQYISPYVSCAIGEYFMDQGRDVLIVYDDLTKHAWAYRQISLVLRRPAGREAYPGDIFYLHSRLLERACRLDKKHGGGSLTALPIIETQEGDLSGYIPTNVISITDGQIFLDTDLFNAGIRPAVNVGASVSRVGGAAQTKAMKQVTGRLKFDLAQYRELAAFAQFESELDEKTRQFLDRGTRMTQLLKQDKNKPIKLASQVAILWIGVKGYLDKLPVSKIEEFEAKFLSYLELKGRKIIDSIEKDTRLDPQTESKLEKFVNEFIELHYKVEEDKEKNK